jgi:transposase
MYCASIDAHSTYLSLGVLDKESRLVLEQDVPADRDALVVALAPFRPLRVVVETSPFWPWIADALVPLGVEFHLAHAKKLRAIADNAQKNDRVDARLLARMLQTDLIPKAYPRSAAQRELLRILRHRTALVRQRSSLAGRIHAQLHQGGLSLPREKLLQRNTRPWLQEITRTRLEREQRRIVRTHLHLIDQLNPLIRALDRRIEREADAWPVVHRLRTVPGIGAHWGLLLAAALLPINRFQTGHHLVSYGGLAPVTRSSGGHTRYGSIPADANRWVRWALVSAVAKHVQHAPDTRISQFYARQKERIGWRKARVAAARKLALVIYAMLKKQQDYQP